MVSTLDGRATLDGRSGPISDAADRQLFHALRTVVDAVMAGAGTVRAERYGPIVRKAEDRRRRAELGLHERPWACIVSAGLALPPDLPLLADPESRVAILTPSAGRLAPTVAAEIDYVRPARADGSLDLAGALAELHDRLHVRTLLCEGGPHLNGALLAAGLVDELFLSVAPLLAGGDPPDDPASAATNAPPPARIVAGAELDPPVELQLKGALEHCGHLFLRYGVRSTSPDRAPRG